MISNSFSVIFAHVKCAVQLQPQLIVEPMLTNFVQAFSQHHAFVSMVPLYFYNSGLRYSIHEKGLVTDVKEPVCKNPRLLTNQRNKISRQIHYNNTLPAYSLFISLQHAMPIKTLTLLFGVYIRYVNTRNVIQTRYITVCLEESLHIGTRRIRREM